jgi:hypothetical protein
MATSFLVALWFQFGHERFGFASFDPAIQLVVGVVVTTTVWVTVTYRTQPTESATLQSFYDRIRPSPGGWRTAVNTDITSSDNNSALFGTGMFLYGRTTEGIVFMIISIAAGANLFRTLSKIGFE